MEQDSSFNKQMRREITNRAIINERIEILEVDIDENKKKLYNVDKEINRIKKDIRRRKQK